MDFIFNLLGGYSIIAIIYAIVMFLFPFAVWQKMNSIIEELKKQNEKLETIEYIKKQEYVDKFPDKEIKKESDKTEGFENHTYNQF